MGYYNNHIRDLFLRDDEYYMKLCFTRVLIVLVILAIAGGCSGSSNTRKTNELVLKAPESAENGDAIPLTLEMPDYIGTGSEITIFVNSEAAVTVRLLEGYQTQKFSTRVRMFHSGSIVARVIKSNGDVLTTYRKVTIGKGAVIPESGQSKNDHRYEYVDGDLKFMVGNNMTRVDSIQTLVVRTNQGKLEFDCTLNLASLPYFALSHDGPVADFAIEIY
ncbi:thiosulfate oxidation carrier protein SoxY [Kaarinaea lacus]